MHTQPEPCADAPSSSIPAPTPRPDRTFRSGVRLPGAAHRLASQLLAQQFWLFGFDIRRAEGNLLLQLGFEKCRPPEGSRVTASRYTCVFPDQRAVMLWGFGLYWRDPTLGGLYLPRSAFAPIVRPSTELPNEAWDRDHIGGLLAPHTALDLDRCRTLLADALTWIREYEHTVAAMAGSAYREHAVQSWKRPCGPVADVPARWQAVIDAVTAVRGVGVYDRDRRAALAHTSV